MNIATTLPPEADLPVHRTEEPLYEVVDGEHVELPPMSVREAELMSILVTFLRNFADEHGLGRAVGETLFALNAEQKLQRRPDVAFVSYDRWPKNKKVPRTNAWDVIPDLAIEVVSRTNFAEEMIERVHEYFEHGVREVWVVYPTIEQINQYASTTAIRVWSRGEELHDSKVLSQLRMPLGVIFEEESASD